MSESCSTTVSADNVVAQPEIYISVYFPSTFNIEISEVYNKRIQRRKIGKIKRKAKGKEYTSPRILLPDDFKKYIGLDVWIFQGKGSVTGQFINLRDQKMLVFVLLREAAERI